MLNFTPITGKNKGEIRLFALSTCVWCKRTKHLLDELGVAYGYLDVDLLTGIESQEAQTELKRWNPKGNFPTLVINQAKCIIGFDEDEIRAEIE